MGSSREDLGIPREDLGILNKVCACVCVGGGIHSIMAPYINIATW